MNSENFYAELDNDTIDFKALFYKYIAYWPHFLAAILFCLGTAFLYLGYADRVYETTAKIKVLEEDTGMVLPSMDNLFSGTKVNLENETEVLNSKLLLGKVVENLNLTTLYYNEGKVKSTLNDSPGFSLNSTFPSDSTATAQYQISFTKKGAKLVEQQGDLQWDWSTETGFIGNTSPNLVLSLDTTTTLADLAGQTYLVSFISKANAVSNLQNSLLVSSVGEDSEILQLKLNGVSPNRSQKILNEIIYAFDLDGIYDRQLVNKRTIAFIDDRFTTLSAELDSIEDLKQYFKQSNNLIVMESETAYSMQNKLASETEVFTLDTQLSLSEMLLSSLQSADSSGLLPANLGLDNQGVSALVGEYNTLLLQVQKLISSAGRNNPSVLILEKQLQDLKKNLIKSAQTYKQQLSLSLDKLNQKSQLDKDLVASIPYKEKRLRAIERQQKIKETLFLFLLEKQQEAAVNLATTSPSIKVIDFASTAKLPISPNIKIVYLGAIVLGLLIPFAILYILFLLDTKIHHKSDLLSVLGDDLPVLTEIPYVKDRRLFTDPQENSFFTEAYRMLITDINYLLSNKPGKEAQVLFFTSSIKGEGKTYNALNTALAYVSMGKKVMLIGADLRNPQLHNYLDCPKDQKGFSDYLHDHSLSVRDCVSKSYDQTKFALDIVFSGAIPPNPGLLLDNGRLESFISEIEVEYDYLIFDAAPVVLVNDSLLITKYTDLVVYLTKAGHTEKELLEVPKRLNAEGKIKNIAILLNGVGSSRKTAYGYGYGYGYGYNYGYGYGYGAKQSKKRWWQFGNNS